LKIITVPADITVKFADGDKTYSLKEVLTTQLDMYAEIKSASMVRQAQKVLAAIETGTGTIALEDADYDLLKAACQKILYPFKVSKSILPFYEAVESAQPVTK
jgi:hypothetical protein